MKAADRRAVLIACVLPWALVLAATCAPPAPADPQMDASYLATLADLGVKPEPAAAIALGHGVCEAFDAGNDFWAVLGELQKTGWSRTDAAVIVGVSISAYCPRHYGELKSDEPQAVTV